MSLTRMGSFIAKVGGTDLKPIFLKVWGEGKMLRVLPRSARNQDARLGSLGSWKEAIPPKESGYSHWSQLWASPLEFADVLGFRTIGTWKGDEEKWCPALGLDKQHGNPFENLSISLLVGDK